MGIPPIGWVYRPICYVNIFFGFERDSVLIVVDKFVGRDPLSE